MGDGVTRAARTRAERGAVSPRIAIGVAIVAIAAVALVVVIRSSPGPSSALPPTATPLPPASDCTPKPCANASGVWLSLVGSRPAPASASGTAEALVVVSVVVSNHSAQPEVVNEEGFHLRDVDGERHDLIDDPMPGCDTWPNTTVAAGASLGPRTLCFAAVPVPRSLQGFVLLWQPAFYPGGIGVPLHPPASPTP